MTGEKTITPDELEQAVANLSSTVSSSGGRFYWVAGVSVLNTILTLFNTNIFFPSGLMVTLLSDYGITQTHNPGWKIFWIIFNLVSYGLYILFGYFAVRRQQWALITGFVLYALDTLLMLPMFALASDAGFYLIINGVFHIWILYIVFQGIRANGALKKIEVAAAQAYYQNQMTAQPPPPFPQSVPSEQPPVYSEQPAMPTEPPPVFSAQPVLPTEQPVSSEQPDMPVAQPATPDEQPQTPSAPPPPPPSA